MLTRWHRQRGEDVWFLTGTDEHGEKVLRSAEATRLHARGVDRPARRGRLAPGAGARSTSPTTTSSARPSSGTPSGSRPSCRGSTTRTRSTQGVYEGPYCVHCEEFKLPGDLMDGEGEYAGQQVCAIHGRPVEYLSETNWFFRMSNFADALLEHYDAHPDASSPPVARNEVLSFIRSGPDRPVDLAVDVRLGHQGPVGPEPGRLRLVRRAPELRDRGRARRSRGPRAARSSRRPGPADVHLVGKDILRFHAVIWPAMLMAAGLAVAAQGLRATAGCSSAARR